MQAFQALHGLPIAQRRLKQVRLSCNVLYWHDLSVGNGVIFQAFSSREYFICVSSRHSQIYDSLVNNRETSLDKHCASLESLLFSERWNKESIYLFTVLSLLACETTFLAATKQLNEWYFPSVCPSVGHTFLTMFLSSDHHEIFRSYYQ